ncbi:hypothetical protein F5Y15DRAFT_259487 [Xylariaceae sp. FL0016]|nr:hypothetical protein F5Y15DRAFT_259487 [Xylariaceae sp. FL0016]
MAFVGRRSEPSYRGPLTEACARANKRPEFNSSFWTRGSRRRRLRPATSCGTGGFFLAIRRVSAQGLADTYLGDHARRAGDGGPMWRTWVSAVRCRHNYALGPTGRNGSSCSISAGPAAVLTEHGIPLAHDGPWVVRKPPYSCFAIYLTFRLRDYSRGYILGSALFDKAVFHRGFPWGWIVR